MSKNIVSKDTPRTSLLSSNSIENSTKDIFVPTMYRLVDLLDYPFVKKVSYQAFNSIRGKSLVKSKSCQDNIWKTFSNIDWWFWFDFPSAAAAVLCVISSQSSRQHSVWILFINFVYFFVYFRTFLIENSQNCNTYLQLIIRQNYNFDMWATMYLTWNC